MKVLPLVLCAAAMAASLALAAPGSDARRVHAQTPTPTPITDLGLNWDSAAGLIGPAPTIRWRTVEGIDHFQLTATLRSSIVNRTDPFCTPPTERATTAIPIDKTLPGTTTELAIDFPPLVETDAWFVSSSEVILRAFAPDGSQIGAQMGGGVAESFCPNPAPTITPPPFDPLFTWDKHDSFTWTTLPSAARYTLAGRLRALRVDASYSFCAPLLPEDILDVTLDQQLAAGVTSFRVELPALPVADTWFVASALADLQAFDASGAVIGTGHVGFLYETYCAAPSPVHLPGTGAASTASGTPIRAMIALLLSGLAIASVGGCLRQRRMGR